MGAVRILRRIELEQLKAIEQNETIRLLELTTAKVIALKDLVKELEGKVLQLEQELRRNSG